MKAALTKIDDHKGQESWIWLGHRFELGELQLSNVMPTKSQRIGAKHFARGCIMACILADRIIAGVEDRVVSVCVKTQAND